MLFDNFREIPFLIHVLFVVLILYMYFSEVIERKWTYVFLVLYFVLVLFYQNIKNTKLKTMMYVLLLFTFTVTTYIVMKYYDGIIGLLLLTMYILTIYVIYDNVTLEVGTVDDLFYKMKSIKLGKMIEKISVNDSALVSST